MLEQDVREFLQIPVLDPRNEEQLAQDSQLTVFNASKGVLSDFSENSPVAALIQGQVFAQGELLYYVNQLPEAAVIAFLTAMGKKRRLGEPAKVELTVYLTAPLNQTRVIPKGTEVLHSGGSIVFATDEDLYILPGNTSGKVNATAKGLGQEYNVPAYTLNKLSIDIAFVSTVTNEEPAQGGGASESVLEYFERVFSELRVRGLVSVSDYEFAAENILGVGSRAVAYGNLGANLELDPGTVSVFCLDSTGQPINQSQINELYDLLGRQKHVCSSLIVKPLKRRPVTCEASIEVLDDADIQTTGESLWRALQSLLDYRTWEMDKPLLVNQVVASFAQVSGVKFVNNIQLAMYPDDSNTPVEYSTALPIPHYEIPEAYSLQLFLRNVKTNTVVPLSFGELEPLNYNPEG